MTDSDTCRRVAERLLIEALGEIEAARKRSRDIATARLTAAAELAAAAGFCHGDPERVLYLARDFAYADPSWSYDPDSWLARCTELLAEHL